MPRLLAAASFILACTSLAAAQSNVPAQTLFSTSVVTQCTPDAMRLCPEHALGSTEMRYCMEAKAKALSRDCMVALEDEGIVPRGTVKSARR
jgi:hypothetical protein